MSRALCYPSDARRLTWTLRRAEALVRAGDRLGGLGGRPGAASRLLSARRAWGPFQTGELFEPPREKLLALSFDLDYQADTDALPALQRLVEDADATMSVVAIGQLVERDPGPYREAIAAGHELVNHTESHPNNPVLDPDREFWHLDAEGMYQQAARAQDTFERHLGVRPVGFRSPHFKDAQPMLAALERVAEFRYLSSTLATATPTGLPYFPARDSVAGADSYRFAPHDPASRSRLLMVPLTPCPRHRFDPFSSYHALRLPRDPSQGRHDHGLDGFASLWREALERAAPDGFASVYFDPMDVMRDDATASVFAAMLREARDLGWRTTTLGEVAATWEAHAAQLGSGGR